MFSGNISDDEMLPSMDSPNQRKSVKGSSQALTNEILKAYQVSSFKYVNSKYEDRGKIGLALLGSKSSGNFSILLYGKGNAALAQATINKDLEITSGRDLYVSFYDAKSENWSILFESLDFYNDFLSRAFILKSVSTKQDFSMFDIKTGDGVVVHDSDLCEAQIIINGVKNCEIVSSLYSSDSQEANKMIRLKIGANKLLPAIDKGISGMMKGGHRIIVVTSQSPFLRSGSIKVANDIGIVAHIKVLRIKTKTDKPIQNNESGDSELSLPNLNFTKEVSNEASDQSKKSDLLKRMEQMGKPIMGFNVTEEYNNKLSKNPENVIPVNYVQQTPVFGIGSEFSQRQPVIGNAPMYDRNMYNNQIIPIQVSNPMMTAVQQMYQPIPQSIPTSGPDCNLVFTETRQHNTEMRIAISKLQDKVDRISDKMDNNNNGSNQKLSPSRHMDAESVFENIKRIIDENEILKRECSQKSDTIDSQNQRINELLNKSQKHLEDSRSVMDRNSATLSNSESESQRIILQLEEEKLNLIRNLSKKTSELSNLEVKVESLNSESQNYRSTSLELNEQIYKLTSELGDLKLKNRTLLTELDKVKEERISIVTINEEFKNSKLALMENEKKLQHNIETLRNNIKEVNNSSELVKKECENEIIETRQHCNDEIENLRKKLKEERRMTNTRSSTLDTEIDSVNKEWEMKFDEFKATENSKLSKLNDRNNQLMTENSNLSHNISELNYQLSLANNSKSVKLEELLGNNRQLQRELDDIQSKIRDFDRLQTDNDNYKKEITSLSKSVAERNKLKIDLESTINKNCDLESMVEKLREEINVKSLTSTTTTANGGDIEQQIKSIMNAIFKKIKLEFELENNYSGKDVNSKCMIIIRDSTVRLMQSNDDDDNSDQESSNSDDSDDESIDPNIDVEEVLIKPENLTQIIDHQNPVDYSKIEHVTSDINKEMVQSDNLQGVMEDADYTRHVPSTNDKLIEPDNVKELIEDGDSTEHVTLDIDMEIIESDNRQRIVEDADYIAHVEPFINKEIIESRDVQAMIEVEDSREHVALDINTEMVLSDNLKEMINEDHSTNNEELILEKDNDVLELENGIDEKVAVLDDKCAETDIGYIQTEEINKVKSEMLPNFSNYGESERINQDTEVFPSNSKIDLVVEPAEVYNNTNDLSPATETIKIKDNDSLFGSDEDDVSDFFEQLNQKKKEKQTKVEQSKPITTDADDDLSWLHS